MYSLLSWSEAKYFIRLCLGMGQDTLASIKHEAQSLDTLPENGAGHKTAQNDFNIKWSMLPLALLLDEQVELTSRQIKVRTYFGTSLSCVLNLRHFL